MMKRLYDWMMRMAGHDKAPHALFWVAFIESSFFPIPPDVMLVPMVLARRAKAWFYATICTVGSVIGGLAGYAIGYFLFEYARPADPQALRLRGSSSKKPPICFNAWGPWILIAKGWTPFPYKVAHHRRGRLQHEPGPFILASIVARAMRFYLVAALLYWFGEPIRDFIEKRLSLVTTAFVILLVGGFVAVKYVF